MRVDALIEILKGFEDYEIKILIEDFENRMTINSEVEITGLGEERKIIMIGSNEPKYNKY
ncbi:hypothetical protein [Terrisporobacter sp.]|uniref:hypothetical protein n=1 Tax=Terrisporobacter sp. TaxID=1965305 RepID=UPI00289F36C6|nr:hypothetical protein [Terrisporobacter sp.]